MKILQINSVCGIRSTGRICTDIADILISNGDECKIAYGREFVPEKYRKYAVSIGNNTDVNFHALYARLFDGAGFGSKRVTKEFIKWVETYSPDIIHLHNIHGYYVNIEILFDYIKRTHTPVIWTLHDCWSFTGHCAHFDFENCDKWKTGCYKCPQLSEYPKSFFDYSRRNFEKKKNAFLGVENMTIVTPSNWLADLVKESFLKEYPVKVIPNGIDLSVFKPTSGTFREYNNLEDKKIILGVASAWGPKKGLDDFIKLSQMLDERFKIVLIGLTEKQKKELPKEIIGIERTNDISELAHLYTTADVFVNPTYEDTYPTVNLESLACGTPVVTYNTGGSPEILEYFGCGRIVEQGSLEGLVSAIMQVEKEVCIEDRRILEIRRMCFEYYRIYHSIV